MGRFYKQSVKGQLTRRLMFIFAMQTLCTIIIVSGSFIGMIYYQFNYGSVRLTNIFVDQLKGEVNSQAGLLSPIIQGPLNDLRIGTKLYDRLENGELKTVEPIEERDWYHFWTHMSKNLEEYRDELKDHSGMAGQKYYPYQPGQIRWHKDYETYD